MRYALTLLAAGLFLGADEAAPKGDKKTEIEGTWVMTLKDREGDQFFEEDLKERITFTGTRYTGERDGKASREGTFKLDPSRNPHRIDITPDVGPYKGKTLLGIYERKGDSLKICAAIPGRSRPEGFKTAPGSGSTLEVYKRE